MTCQETDGRKTSVQGDASNSNAETSFNAESLLPTPAPFSPQLEQVSPRNELDVMAAYQMNTDPFASGMMMDTDFIFPDYFEQIMMPDVGNTGTHEHVSMPLNVADFTQG